MSSRKIIQVESVFAIGGYPEVGLADARAERDSARALVKQDRHPPMFVAGIARFRAAFARILSPWSCCSCSFSGRWRFSGGVRAHQQLNATLTAIQAAQVVYPQIVIGGVAGKLEDGCLVDEAANSFLMDGVRRLVQLVDNWSG